MCPSRPPIGNRSVGFFSWLVIDVRRSVPWGGGGVHVFDTVVKSSRAITVDFWVLYFICMHVCNLCEVFWGVYHRSPILLLRIGLKQHRKNTSRIDNWIELNWTELNWIERTRFVGKTQTRDWYNIIKKTHTQSHLTKERMGLMNSWKPKQSRVCLSPWSLPNRTTTFLLGQTSLLLILERKNNCQKVVLGIFLSTAKVGGRAGVRGEGKKNTLPSENVSILLLKSSISEWQVTLGLSAISSPSLPSP